MGQTGNTYLALLVLDKEESTGGVVICESHVCSVCETVEFNIMKREKEE